MLLIISFLFSFVLFVSLPKTIRYLFPSFSISPKREDEKIVLKIVFQITFVFIHEQNPK